MNQDKDRTLAEIATLMKELIGDRTQELLADLQDQLKAKRTTLESRLSNLVNAKPAGVNYFFGQDRERGEALLSLAGADDEQRRQVLSCVDAALADDGAPRLVVDITDWPTKPERWAKPLQQAILERGPKPAVVILTPEQHELLPRSFDDLARLVKVESPDAAPEEVRRYAGDDALVVSARRVDPWSRWIAVVAPPAGGFRMEPAMDEARLNAVRPEPMAYLDELGIQPRAYGASHLVPKDPIELRRLLEELETGTGTEGRQATPNEHEALRHPEERLGLAQALGVRAAATRAECIEADRARLAGQLGALDCGRSGDLDALLERARRRPVENAALLVDDELHLVNFDGTVDGGRFVRVVRHTVEHAEPALVRLREAVAERTEVDWLGDPFMASTLVGLCAEGFSVRELLHARATLHHAGLLVQKPLTRSAGVDWQARLLRILESPPASAVLRATLQIRGERPRQDYHVGIARPDASKLELSLEVPPFGHLVLSRDGGAPVVVARTPLADVPLDQWRNPEIAITTDPDTAKDAERWLELYEMSSGLVPPGATARYAERDTTTPRLSSVPCGAALDKHRRESPVPVPAEIWTQADRLVAVSSWTLREGLAARATHPLPGGGWLVRIGATGFIAELEVYDVEHLREPSPAMVDVDLTYYPRGGALSDARWELTRFVWHSSASSDTDNVAIGGMLPIGLTYQGEGLYVRVRYAASPLLGPDPLGRNYVAGAAVAAREEDEASYDDD
ncbi:MAG: hypothetical protein H6719_32765 [Sandaracinaceae bacterium]|nr:hypothetical protein [Sandaracinaceae bacterium]